ncbi:hypothetical protein JZO70_18390 [Enterococcus sp. 669A]|uniref:Uncharacterized protein n=1 Tax=Candidatus Enterococcus moelleringii TaxID=2815325 RepID=A0ABS3LET7_9ENTE|nr:hypothetical protein [Enterococcus sp. 669A]MBO1308151.1 hypothetical protein [Enterococcus sp. 669A]
MAGFDLFVVGMCGLLGVVTTYSGLLFYREREFSYILFGMCAAMVSFVCYNHHFAERDTASCKGLFVAFWVVSVLFFIVKARLSKNKEVN